MMTQHSESAMLSWHLGIVEVAGGRPASPSCSTPTALLCCSPAHERFCNTSVGSDTFCRRSCLRSGPHSDRVRKTIDGPVKGVVKLIICCVHCPLCVLSSKASASLSLIQLVHPRCDQTRRTTHHTGRPTPALQYGIITRPSQSAHEVSTDARLWSASAAGAATLSARLTLPVGCRSPPCPQ